MKGVKLAVSVTAGIIAAAAAGLAIANPGPEAYERYAVERLNQQLENSLCGQVPAFLNSTCASVLTDQAPWLQEVIEAQTVRHNFLLFSIYETDLAAEAALERLLPANLSLEVDGLPVYHVKSVGILNQFFTYRVKQVRN